MDEENVIQEGFREGVARLCAKCVWRQLNSLRMKKKTVRLLRGREVEREFVTQPQIADKVYRDQGTVARWFRDGTPEWANMAMVMTDLAVELEHLQDPFPDRDMRVIAGRRLALKRIKEMMEGIEVSEPSDEQVCCLMALCEFDKWRTAKTLKDAVTRIAILQELTPKIAERADAILGKGVSLRKYHELLSVEAEWGIAWERCRKHIIVKWSVA